jgi:hypothetical protein
MLPTNSAERPRLCAGYMHHTQFAPGELLIVQLMVRSVASRVNDISATSEAAAVEGVHFLAPIS